MAWRLGNSRDRVVESDFFWFWRMYTSFRELPTPILYVDRCNAAYSCTGGMDPLDGKMLGYNVRLAWGARRGRKLEPRDRSVTQIITSQNFKAQLQ